MESVQSLSYEFDDDFYMEIIFEWCIFYEEIINELCILYNEERIKNKNAKLTLDTIEMFLTTTNQNPDDIINLCLNCPINSTVYCFLGTCYRFGKWVEKDEKKEFFYYRKSAEMEHFDGLFNLGICYDIGIG